MTSADAGIASTANGPRNYGSRDPGGNAVWDCLPIPTEHGPERYSFSCNATPTL